MNQTLMNKQQIAAALGTTPQAAASILRRAGVMPIDFGRGRGLGPRWLSSAVDSALLNLHIDAQPKPKIPKIQRKKDSVGAADMTPKQLFELTTAQCVQ